MKRISVLLLLSLVAAATIESTAAPRTRVQAEKIAQDQMIALHLSSKVQFVLAQQPRQSATLAPEKNVAASDDAASYFVFNNTKGEGFTIVSGDDRLPEVVAYSTKGTFDAAHIPAALQHLLDDYSTMVENLGSSSTSQSKVIRRAATTAVSPLIKTKWDQEEPYNNLCPSVTTTGSDGTTTTATCKTGCIATAMAQIINYYYHTANNLTSSTFTTEIPGYTTKDLGISIDAISGDRTYDWSLMCNTYPTNGYTAAQAAAVAKLVYHAGVSVNMNFRTGESTTQTTLVQNALSNYFDMTSSYLEVSTSSSMQDIVDSELNASRPVLISGTTEQTGTTLTGHAFICDGRDTDGLYHINWGLYDGYFDDTYVDISLLNIYEGGGNAYKYNNKMVYGFKISASELVKKSVEELEETYNTYAALIEKYRTGTEPGMVSEGKYNALQTALSGAAAIINNGGSGKNSAEITAYKTYIESTYQLMVESRVPYEDGIYYLEAYGFYNTTAAYDNGSSVAWKAYDKNDASFRWKLTYDSANKAYTLQNVGTGKYIGTSTFDSTPTTATSEDKIIFEEQSYSENDGFIEYIQNLSKQGTTTYIVQSGSYNYGRVSGVVKANILATTTGTDKWRLVKYIEEETPDGDAQDVSALTTTYNTYSAYLPNFTDFVGNDAFMYPAEKYYDFNNALIAAKSAIDAGGKGYTADEITALGNNVKTAYTALKNAWIKLENGNYYIEAYGFDGEYGMYDNSSSYIYWGKLEEGNKTFIWNFSYLGSDTNGQGFSVCNVATGSRMKCSQGSSIGASTTIDATSSAIMFEPAMMTEDGVVGYIRNIYNGSLYYTQRTTKYTSTGSSVYPYAKGTYLCLWRLVRADKAEDMNEDFKVSIVDVTRLVNVLNGGESISKSDVDGNGSTDVEDVECIKKSILKE